MNYYAGICVTLFSVGNIFTLAGFILPEIIINVRWFRAVNSIGSELKQRISWCKRIAFNELRSVWYRCATSPRNCS